ncbi:MAG: hypothetical protein JNM71_07730 [Flavobacterium lindanitolerans]|uniref:hypothetical protein n=1 Tax=Flavobacterium lindanitolerans TaxID=428988 RepID=UPI001A42B086|nr:hypothetical protein [Flavobacterium lindanitolerans]MBL7867897.1 hypothetical protein [Flavobacterium lindanitolerans]
MTANRIKDKINEILNYISSDNIDKPIFEVDENHIVEEIDRILGKNKFIYYDNENARICLIFKKRNKYTIKMYWINHFLGINN